MLASAPSPRPRALAAASPIRPLFAFIALSTAAIASDGAHASAFRLEPAGGDPEMLRGIAGVSDAALADPASSGAPSEATASTDAPPRVFGAADSWHLDFGGSYALEVGSDDNDAGDSGGLGIANVGAHWFVADGLSFGAFAEAIYASQDPDDSFGGGLGLLARWYFAREASWTLFAEGGCGFVVFDNDTPPGGTDFNFTPRAGVGATIRLSDSAQLVGRVGWFHISNGQTGDDNPGYDSIAIGLGLALTF